MNLRPNRPRSRQTPPNSHRPGMWQLWTHQGPQLQDVRDATERLGVVGLRGAQCPVGAAGLRVEQIAEREQDRFAVDHRVRDHDPAFGSVVDDAADLNSSVAMVRIDRDSLFDQVKGEPHLIVFQGCFPSLVGRRRLRSDVPLLGTPRAQPAPPPRCRWHEYIRGTGPCSCCRSVLAGASASARTAAERERSSGPLRGDGTTNGSNPGPRLRNSVSSTVPSASRRPEGPRPTAAHRRAAQAADARRCRARMLVHASSRAPTR